MSRRVGKEAAAASAIIIHGLDHARAALSAAAECERRVILLSAPGAAGYAGAPWFLKVVALARRWEAAGATVCISEAEPIPELVADGWHAVDITHTRKGQRRTFSKQQAEWLTMSRPPAWTP